MKNPFDPGRDPDRHAIWETLMRRDLDAFVEKDWARVERDFDPDRFEGITAGGSPNPRDWRLTYPTLESYRDDWLKEADDFLKMPLRNGSPRELIWKMSSLDEIEIQGDRALCHKKFVANEALADGRQYAVCCQTLYRMHRVRGEWKIAGFVGYLPLGMAPV